MLSGRYYIVSQVVLVFSLVIAGISLIPVVFPALISETVMVSDLEKIGITPAHQEEPFQVGPMAVPLIVINGMIFALYFLRNKLGINSKFERLSKFQVSNKVATIVIVIILSGYVIGTVPELGTEEKLDDWIGIEKRLSEAIRDGRFTIQDAINGNPNYPMTEPHVKYSLLLISEKTFGNFKVIPFLASIALLLVTYFITKEITRNNFAGIISVLLVLQSSIFLTYDTSPTYSNFWILLYMLSLYVIVKVWVTSPILFGLSVFSKALAAAFAPMSIFFILNSEISRNYKIILTLVMITVVSIGGVLILETQGITEQFRWNEFWMGFVSFAFQMRWDTITILFLVPLIFGLFLSSKKCKHANSISILIAGVLLSAPLLTGMTDQTNQPYRFLPLIVFFAVGVGVLFSSRRV